MNSNIIIIIMIVRTKSTRSFRSDVSYSFERCSVRIPSKR